MGPLVRPAEIQETARAERCSARRRGVEPMVDYKERTLTELADGINQTNSAIGRCREILGGLGQPKTEGLKAVVEAIRNLLPKLEQDLTDLQEALDDRAKASSKRIS
jgi:hypothetical protein